MKVSVIIPVYQVRDYLIDTIASVTSQQTKAHEILIIDDGNKELIDMTTLDVQGPIKVVRQDHRGAGAARNTGIANSHGELIAFLDADDLWLPGKLDAQVNAFSQDPELEAVFTHMDEFLSSNVDWKKAPEARKDIPALLPSSCLVKREFVLRVGPFNENSPSGEFIDWYMRAQDMGMKSRTLPEVHVRRRIHDKNLTGGENHSTKSTLKFLKQHLDRQRREDS